MAAPGTGLSLIFSYISESNINSMLLGSTLALVVISFILIFALRSFRIGLISLVPNLVPAAMAFGLWGYISGDVGLAIAVVVAMTLGIVVDDTVHFLSKYLRARRENGMDPFEATRYAFSTVGMALWVTSVTLVAGFGALAFSGFKVNADMGLLSAATIAMALIADFLFLPTLLMKLDTRRSDAPGPV
jgi:predicted RND superfamily exporter protein